MRFRPETRCIFGCERDTCHPVLSAAPNHPWEGSNGRTRLLGRAALTLYTQAPLARVHLLVSLTSLCCGFQFWNSKMLPILPLIYWRIDARIPCTCSVLMRLLLDFCFGDWVSLLFSKLYKVLCCLFSSRFSLYYTTNLCIYTYFMLMHRENSELFTENFALYHTYLI